MKKEQLMFLLGGFAFGVLVGFGLFRVYQDRPQLAAAGGSQEIASPAGPRAPAQGAVPQGGGAAPMVSQINELKRRLEANPQDLEAAVTVAGMYYQVGMWEQAEQFYDIALGIKPDDPDLLTDSGNVQRELGRHTRALDSFRQAYEVDPTHWQALFNTVVVAAFDLQRMDLADAAMARLDEVDPPPPELPALKQALAEFRTTLSTSDGTP